MPTAGDLPAPGRRAFLAGAGALLCAPAIRPARAEAAIDIIDVAGRRVTLLRPATRVVFGAWLSLDALAMIHPDPVSILAGWQGAPGATLDEGLYDDLTRRFPGILDVPKIGRFTLDGAGSEAVLGLNPDLIVLSVFDAFGMGGSEGGALRAPFEAAGIPVLILDFFLDPLGKSEASLRALGRAVGREAEADACNRFYRGRLDRVRSRIAAKGDALKRPSVFAHVHAASPDCCYSPGQATLDEFIRVAGGRNIGADVITGATGQLSLEYVLSRDPDVYVATGAFERDPTRFALGRGVSAERARAGLKGVISRPGLADLGAVAAGRAHGLWHHFAHTPVHAAAIERLATWFHPELFGDLDPDATLDELNRLRASLPMEGTFWTTA